MKRLTYILYFFVFSFVILLTTSCEKDNDTSSDLLFGTWQMVEWKGYCPAGNKTSSSSSYKDNTVTFRVDQTFVIDYGKNRANGEPDTGNNSGEWTSEKNGVKQVVKITKGKFLLRWDISSFTITELTENKLVMEWAVKGAHPKGPTIYVFKR